MKIEYPSQAEIDAQILKIMGKGIKPKHSFFYYIKDMYRNLGVRHIFHGIGDVIFIMLIAGIAFGGITLELLQEHNGNIFSFLFTLSPILYISICLLSFWKEKQTGTLDVKMACKYTVFHLSAFRMLTFSSISMVCNTIYIAIISLKYLSINFWSLLAVSLSSLFIFSVFFLYVLLYAGQKNAAPYIFSIGWIGVNATLIASFGSSYEAVLASIPGYLYLLVAVIMLWCYISGLKQLILGKAKGVVC